MQHSIFLVILCATSVAYASQEVAKASGLRFIGIGYNVLEGNPEGGQQKLGGVDPGLRTTRKIFQLTWLTNKTTVDRKYLVPDQVNFDYRSSCVEKTNNKVISGAKSYQDRLKVDVDAEGSYDSGLWNVAFSLSSRYEEMEKETSVDKKVFFEEMKVCNKGTARYLLDLARTEKFSVTKDFASALCNLPEAYDEDKYRKFIEDWGTDIVSTVQLGTRKTTRYESSYSNIAKYAMENNGASVSASGGGGGGSASLSVDVEKFGESATNKSEFAEDKVVFTSGGPDLPEPIGITLHPIHNAMEESFFSTLNNSYQCELEQRKSNTERILKELPRLKKLRSPEDPEVSIPVVWPRGTYGLPKPKSGCPRLGIWHEGLRFHDTQDGKPSNSWSTPYDLDGRANIKDMEQKFCMRTNDKQTNYDLNWPKGKYCIFKKGACPKGLSGGWLQWDDEDDDNINKIGGSLPEGAYTRNTRIQYCCRTDGWSTNPINLPTDSPFVLFPYSHQCQKVNGMNVRKEWFRWDNEDDSGYITEYDGEHPEVELTNNNLKVYYCYYYNN